MGTDVSIPPPAELPETTRRVVMEALMVDRAANNGPRCPVVSCGMERGFLSQKGSGVRRGVKEKDLNGANCKTVKDGVIPPITVGSNSNAFNFEVVIVSAIPSTIGASDVNALDKSSYTNVTCNPSGTKVNFCTLFTLGGNRIDVVIPVDSIRAISERFVNTGYGFFLGKRVAYPVVANYVVAGHRCALCRDYLCGSYHLSSMVVLACIEVHGKCESLCHISVFPPLTGCDRIGDQSQVVLQDALKALVDGLLEAMLIKSMSLVAMWWQAYSFVVRDTEIESYEGPIETKETQALSPRTASLSPDYNPSTPHPDDDTTRMVMRTQPTLSPGYSARLTKAISMSPSSFHKRYIPSRETASPTASPVLPLRKRYRGTSELILYTNSERDEIRDEDTDPNMDSEDSEGRSTDSKGEEAIPEDQQHQALLAKNTTEGSQQTVDEVPTQIRTRICIIWVNPEDGTEYTDIPIDLPRSPPSKPLLSIGTPSSPDWSPEYIPKPLPIPSPVAAAPICEDEFLEIGAELALRGSMLHDYTECLNALPPTLFDVYDRDLWELYTRSREVKDEIFSQRYRLKSLEQGQERATVTFNALW
uniref:Uncharacterized protein n=1 Tax=Tanacetum cinerariifolium TaxID=118510 RepID=A0A6L2NL47_TANCI|nr:hypothetical protein [Tanacetum cinerariifolium]